ncbi:hypothetical protein [Devosia soli]|nr:hypothetical protein [Devosia soli]
MVEKLLIEEERIFGQLQADDAERDLMELLTLLAEWAAELFDNCGAQGFIHTSREFKAVIERVPVGMALGSHTGLCSTKNMAMVRFMPLDMPSYDLENISSWDFRKTLPANGPWPDVQAVRGTPVRPGVEAQFSDGEGGVISVRMATEPVVDGTATVIAVMISIYELSVLGQELVAQEIRWLFHQERGRKFDRLRGR